MKLSVGMRIVDTLTGKRGSIVDVQPAESLVGLTPFTVPGELAYFIKFDSNLIEVVDLEGNEEVIEVASNEVWALAEEIEPLSPLIQLAESIDDQIGD